MSSSRMNRRTMVRLTVASAIGTVLVASCGAPPASPGAATAAPSSAPAQKPAASAGKEAKVTFAFNSSQKEVESAWNPIREGFRKANPNVQVEFMVTPTSEEHAQKVLAMFAGGTPPDLIFLAATRDYKRTAAKKVLLNLDPLMKQDNFNMDDFVPVCKEASLYCNKVYGLPIHLGYDVTYFNKTMFEKAGLKTPDKYQAEGKWNQDTVVEVGKILSKGEGATKTFGLTRRTGLQVQEYMIWSFGGKVLSDDLSTWLATDDPKSVQALQYLVDLVRVHKIAPTDDDMTGLGDMFLTGRVGFTLGGRYLVSQLREIKDWEIGMTLPPAGPAGLVTREGPVVISLAEAGKQRDAAWSFARYFASLEGQTMYTAGGRGASGLKAIFDSPDFKKLLLPWENPDVYREGISKARMQIATKWQEINKVFDDQMMLAYLGKQSLADSAKAMKEKITPHLGEECS